MFKFSLSLIDLAKIVQQDQNTLKKLVKKSKFVRKSTAKSQTNDPSHKQEICDQLEALNIDTENITKNVSTAFKMTTGNEAFKFNFIS